MGGPPGGAWVQPPQGYGPPMGANPYGAPMAGPGMMPAVQGSMGLGFLAGFLGGCIGLILVLIIAKGPETKRGAGIGFAVALVLGVILNVAMRH